LNTTSSRENSLRTILKSFLRHLSSLGANYTVDITHEWSKKLELMTIHKSQWGGIRKKSVFSRVRKMAETDGKRIGVPYGEGFRCVHVGPEI